MKTFFINEAFQKGVLDYLESKDKPNGVIFNSFLVVVVRALCLIYGELDIINPFQIKSETALKNNLQKFGYTEEELNNFWKLLDGFLVIERRNMSSIKREVNHYFIDVQKSLVDMFNLKRLNFGLTENDSREFFNLLYTPGTNNELRLSYNFLNAENIYEVAEYYRESLQKKKEIKEEEKDLLSFDVYKLFNFSISDLSKMDKDDVDKLNSEIYRTLNISETAINKDYLLNEKLKEIRLQNKPITTGNGYVDILLIMSIIVTVVMVVVIFASLII